MINIIALTVTVCALLVLLMLASLQLRSTLILKGLISIEKLSYLKEYKNTEVTASELRKAIGKNQFILHYQPQYSLTNNRVMGVEALVRWNHPKYGVLSPDKFIPLAESSNLITQLDYLTLRTACRQHKMWGLENLRLSVNFSASQFVQVGFIQQVKKIIEQEGMSPSLLDIEITESIYVSDIESTALIMKELRDIGIQLALDDFGTGYSSLSKLQRLPITSLKIDKSFIDSLENNEKGEAFIELVIGLAKSLKLRVVAEGVETKEQLDVLRGLSCDEVQGYLLSPPVNSNNFELFMKNENFQLGA